MEISSQNVFSSPKGFGSEKSSDSGKSKKLSENRYTPTRNEEQGSRFVFSICQDSLEIPKPRSKLIEFRQLRDGEEKQVIMPLFFHSKGSMMHQRQSSLKPVAKKRRDIGEMLLNLRAKTKGEFKSSLKSENKVKKHKTVSFCSQIEQLSPDSLMSSVVYVGDKQVLEDSLESCSRKSNSTNLPMTSNEHSCNKTEKFPETTTSTQQNLEHLEELEEEEEEEEEEGEGEENSENLSELGNKPEFHFESEVRSSLNNREVEFNEYSNIAYCEKCKKEVVTAVEFQRIRGQSCAEVTEWLLCWVFPDCMYKRKKLLHTCPNCNFEIARIDW